MLIEPTDRESYLPHLLAVFFLFIAASSYEYATEKNIEAQNHSLRADRNRDALLACLNGGAPGLFIEQPDGSRNYLVCDHPYEVSDKNVKLRRTS